MADYKVALEIFAAGNVEQFLSSISSKLLGIHGKTKEIEKSLGNWGKLIGGALLVGAGIETLKFIDHIAKAGGELQRQANIFRSAGNSIEDTTKAIKGAFDSIQKAPGVDAVDAMRRYRELAGATQDNAGSLTVLPEFLKAQVIYKATTGADPEEGMQRIVKMIELRQGAIDHATHRIDPEKFAKELDVALKALQVGQGLITANDLQNVIKQAGPVAKGMDPLKFWSIYLASVEDQGGARTGTALTAVARQVLGGIMLPKVADEWERLEMLNPVGQGWNMQKGHVQIKDPEKAIKGYSTFRDEGFQDFIEKFVKPAFEKHGVKTDQQKNAELYRFASTETARRLYSIYLTGAEQVEAEQKKIRNAMGLDSYDKVFGGGKDYQVGIDSLTASIKSLEEALGGPAGRAVGKIASEIAEQINKLAKLAIDHPQIVELGTYAVTAAAGLAILAGSILAVTAALRIGGWIVGAGAAAKAAVGAAEGAGAGAAAKAASAGAAKGGLSGFLKSGLKGGIIAGIVEAAGEALLNQLLPLTPEAQKVIDKNSVGNRLSQLWKWLNTPPAGSAAAPQSGALTDAVMAAKAAAAVHATTAAEKANWNASRDIMLNQAYARQRDMHPMVRGERDMEGARANALSKLVPDDLMNKIQTSAQQGAQAGFAQGATGAQPAIRGALQAGTSSGVLAGLQAASGSARAIVAGWFAGIGPGIGASAARAASGFASPAQRVNFQPPSPSQRPVQVHTTVALDGRPIARAVSKHLAAMGTHPTRVARSDPGMGFSTQDFGFST